MPNALFSHWFCEAVVHIGSGHLRDLRTVQPAATQEVVKTMQEITRRIRQAGRRMQADVMQGAWVSDMVLDAGRRILPS
jgi:hypothetical protein